MIDSWNNYPSKGIKLIHSHGIDSESEDDVFMSDRSGND
jgi:hypothetical protein